MSMNLMITSKKKISANYKLAIPQYYEGKIQLLLPLCLMSDDKPDVAIAVTKKRYLLSRAYMFNTRYGI